MTPPVIIYQESLTEESLLTVTRVTKWQNISQQNVFMIRFHHVPKKFKNFGWQNILGGNI